jgi:hypothetical protein
MRLAMMLYLSLLILPNIAHAADLERKEHDIVTATGRAVIAAGDNNYRAAVAECEKARSIAGADNYLLGLVERCLGWAERGTEGAAHVRPACAYFSRAISLWQPSLPSAGDSKQVEKRKRWLNEMVSYRKAKGC